MQKVLKDAAECAAVLDAARTRLDGIREMSCGPRGSAYSWIALRTTYDAVDELENVVRAMLSGGDIFVGASRARFDAVGRILSEFEERLELLENLETRSGGKLGEARELVVAAARELARRIREDDRSDEEQERVLWAVNALEVLEDRPMVEARAVSVPLERIGETNDTLNASIDMLRRAVARMASLESAPFPRNPSTQAAGMGAVRTLVESAIASLESIATGAK
jgi:hypothetical protein